VGLSNRSSNKLLLRLFLQRCNDQFGNVRVFLQQAVRLFRRVIQRLFLRHISPLLEEIRLYLLRQPAALLVVGMGVQICYHTGLCVASIALHRLDVSAADLQLQRGTAMPQTVKNYRRQSCGIGQLAEQKGNLPFLVGTSVLMGNHKAKVLIIAVQHFFCPLLPIFLLCERHRNGFRQKYLPHTAFRF